MIEIGELKQKLILSKQEFSNEKANMYNYSQFFTDNFEILNTLAF